MAGSWDALDLAEIDFFDDDLDLLVHKHHALTLDSIDQFQKQKLKEARSGPKDRLEDFNHEELDYIEWQCEGMKQATGNLALVSLVSRFIHRIIKLHGDVQSVLPKNSKHQKLMRKCSELISKLRSLDERLGPGGVDIGFFSDLEIARNSVVHHNSQTHWFERRHRLMMVSLRYRGSDNRVQFDADDLIEAIDNCKKQVRGYSARLRELTKKGKT